MGAVTLRAKDLDAMLLFYRDALGLDVVADMGATVILGHGKEPALIVESAPELKYAGSHEAGLFHTAFLYETREALANAVKSVAQQYPGSFTGSADHLVSEAFYFNDPEGNGVELYFDRDRSSWSWQHGQIQMDTLSLDPNRYLQENSSESKLVATTVGHVHLSVGNIPQAKDFYVDILGFDVTMNFAGTALFVSSGGYHHHMAMNIWRSRGAGVRQKTLGLGDVSISLPDANDLGETKERLRHYKIQLRDLGDKVHLDDPWGNQVTLSMG